MVNERSSDLDALFHALADGTRRSLLERLADGTEYSVTALAGPHRMSLAAVSKHLRVLERGGLVRRRVEGRRHLLSIDPAGLEQAAEWLAWHTRFWNERLDVLETMLADDALDGEDAG